FANNPAFCKVSFILTSFAERAVSPLFVCSISLAKVVTGETTLAVVIVNSVDTASNLEGITDLRGEIQQNQKYAQQLIEELTKLRDSIGHDVRAFGSNKELLQSILKNQGADVDADQKRLEEVLGSVNYYKQLESDGFNV
ncbi:HBL/NHE enterotoxin family protein, partial [Bacillus sp. HC-Mk]